MSEVNSSRKKVAWSAIIIMTSMVVSRITGFLREALVVNRIADRLLTDGYTYAFTITDFFYFLLLGGAIASSLIPVLTGYIAKKDEKNGWRGVSTFINVFMIVIIIACAVGIIFSRELLDVWFPRYAKDAGSPESIEYYRNTVAQVIAILFPSVVCMMVTGFMNGVLNSYKRFAAAAYGPSIYNIGCCISIYFLGPYGIVNVAYGVLASSVLYMIIQIMFTRQHLTYYRPILNLKHEGFKRLIMLAVPTLVSSGVAQLNVTIVKTFTQNFDAGAVTALNNASTLWQMPYGIFAMGIGTAMLPSIAEKYSTGNMDDYKDTVRGCINFVLFLTIPAMIAFFVLPAELSSCVYKWSGNVNVVLTGRILMCYSFAILTHSVSYICYRAFYAANNTKLPMISAVISVIVTTAAGYVIVHYTNFGVAGVALTYSLASFISMLYITVAAYIKLGNFGLKSIVITTVKSVFAGGIMAAVLILLKNIMPVSVDGMIFAKTEKIHDLINLAVYMIAGVGIYAIAAWILRMEQMVMIKEAIAGKLIKKAKKS